MEGKYRDQSRRVINALHRQNFRNARRQRLLKRDYRGGYPPSRPIPLNVDPETGEIRESLLDHPVLNTLIGERTEAAKLGYRREPLKDWGKTASGYMWWYLPHGELRTITRIIVSCILAVTIAWGVVSYQHQASIVEERRQAFYTEQQEKRTAYLEWFNTLSPERQAEEIKKAKRLARDWGGD